MRCSWKLCELIKCITLTIWLYNNKSFISEMFYCDGSEGKWCVQVLDVVLVLRSWMRDRQRRWSVAYRRHRHSGVQGSGSSRPGGWFWRSSTSVRGDPQPAARSRRTKRGERRRREWERSRRHSWELLKKKGATSQASHRGGGDRPGPDEPWARTQGGGNNGREAET